MLGGHNEQTYIAQAGEGRPRSGEGVHVVVDVLDHDLRRLPEKDVVLLVRLDDRLPFALYIA
jgi:hypothetical protein